MTRWNHAANIEDKLLLRLYRRRCALCSHGAFSCVVTRDGQFICVACYQKLRSLV